MKLCYINQKPFNLTINCCGTAPVNLICSISNSFGAELTTIDFDFFGTFWPWDWHQLASQVTSQLVFYTDATHIWSLSGSEAEFGKINDFSGHYGCLAGGCPSETLSTKSQYFCLFNAVSIWWGGWAIIQNQMFLISITNHKLVKLKLIDILWSF